MTPPLPCDFLVSWETKFQCQYVSTGFLLSTFDFFCFVLLFWWTCLFSQFFRKKIPTWIEDPFSPLTKDKISFKVLRTMVLDLNPVADKLNGSSMLVKGRCVWMNIDAPNMNCKAKTIEFCCFSRCKFVRDFSLKKRTALKWVLNGRVCSDYFRFSQWPNSY